MASCKECIHFDRCKGLYKFDRLQKAVSKGCSYFRDRSRFVELPCKAGDTVYSVHGHPDYGYKIEALQAQDVALICSSGELSYSKRLNYFGKTVFLTREEAEQALKEREENA